MQQGLITTALTVVKKLCRSKKNVVKSTILYQISDQINLFTIKHKPELIVLLRMLILFVTPLALELQRRHKIIAEHL